MKTRNLFYLGLAFIGFASSVKAEDYMLREDVNKLKEDMIIVQRQLYREKNDNIAPVESTSNVQMRLGEYDQLIRDMNGKVENIEYRLGLLEKKIETFDKDIELRLEQFKRQSQNADYVEANKTTPQAVKEKAPSGISAKELYEQALKDLRDNKNNDAERKFNQFLNTYPGDALAGNAQYWLGEVYYKKQEFDKAAVAFRDGYSKYPEGTKGADCLLKLGLSMKALGKKDDACTALVNLPTVFGKANSEIISRAKKEAEALGCK